METRLKFEIEQLKAKLHEREAEIEKLLTRVEKYKAQASTAKKEYELKTKGRRKRKNEKV